MKNSTLKNYPRMMGFKYDPADFIWAVTEPLCWDWNVTEANLTKFTQLGGTIKQIQRHNLTDWQREQLARLTTQPDQLVADQLVKDWQGLAITLPANVELNEPLQLKINVNSAATPLIVLLNIGANSRLNLTTDFHFTAETPQSSIVFAGEVSGQLDYRTEWHAEQPGNHLLLGELTVQQSARCSWTVLPKLRGKLLGNLKIKLAQPGASGYFYAGSLAHQDDQFNLQTQIQHFAPHTFSRIKMRGVLFDNAKMNFTSVGQIKHGAHGANADQENRLLTAGTEVLGSANPMLLIDENDVQAGHAASVGQYDEEQLYYLQSRGLPLALAEQILINAFMQPVMRGLIK
ncbi:SufB/SufD family protein [Lentilactobacillus senioris]|uniref:SufB/SufD family protein n=1 Tax=Lentilactobacillus senioris TaxID=931534 RepID=UPI003D284ACE